MNQARVKARKRARRRAAVRRKRLIAFFALAGILLLTLIFWPRKPAAQKPPDDAWVLENATFEIAAPPLENGAGTLDIVQTAPTLAPFDPERTPEPLPAATVPAMPTLPPLKTAEPAREPEPTLIPETVSITITAAGDCTLGGDVKGIGYERFREAVSRHGYDYFLQNVRDIFAEDDITIVNLEGPLTTSTDMRPNRPFNFRGDPQNVRILTSASVEVCNVANNHSQDFRKSGLTETAETLQNAGIGVCGYSVVHYEEIRGVRVGFVGLTEWDYTEDEVRQLVASVREQCDLLVVSMHWGVESSYETTALQRRLGHASVDAGADLVLGTHSHVIGEIEQYGGKYIIYSLGNFCFGGNGSPADMDTLIFQQRFDIAADGTVADGGICVIPCSISSAKYSNNFQPTPLSGAAATRLMQKIRGYSRVDTPVLLKQEN